MKNKSFAEKAELTLIVVMVLSILSLTISPRVLWLYQLSLGMLLGSTLLQIAVGNLPKDADFKRSIKLIAIILSIVLCVFLLGIALVPTLSSLGR